MTEKIIVMRGSFNPPTIAHRTLLLAVVDALRARAGLFVPSSDAYVRRKMRQQGRAGEVLTEDLRARMLYQMCRADQRLAEEECEFQDDGKGHTFDTMEKIQKHLLYPSGTRRHRRDQFLCTAR